MENSKRKLGSIFTFLLAFVLVVSTWTALPAAAAETADAGETLQVARHWRKALQMERMLNGLSLLLLLKTRRTLHIMNLR